MGEANKAEGQKLGMDLVENIYAKTGAYFAYRRTDCELIRRAE